MQRFQNILLHVTADQDEGVTSRAIELAIENNARLTFIDVIRPIPEGIGLLVDKSKSADLERLIAEDHRRELLERASEYSDTSVPLNVVVRVGSPAIEIVRQVISGEHDLVINTADGHAAFGKLFGGVAKSLMRTCPCPVWAIKPEIPGSFDVVLAAVDLEDKDPTHRELNQDIIKFAHSIAIRDNAKLHVVSAWDVWMEPALRRHTGHEDVDRLAQAHQDQIRASLDDLLQWVEADLSPAQIHLCYGPAAYVVRLVARETKADLLVMGTVCRSGIAGLLIGNTAEQLLGEADCSVLALKPKGFQTPISLTDDAAPLPLV